jgi:hypothetical protein
VNPFQRIMDLEEEVKNLRERWACVECGRTPSDSGDLYRQVCHACHRCMECAEPTCTICGDAIGMRLRIADLRRENKSLKKELAKTRALGKRWAKP